METHRSLVFPAEKTNGLQASWVWAVYGLVNPPAEAGHGRVHAWKPWISTAVSPGDQAVDPSITHQRPSGISLEHQNPNIPVKPWIVDSEGCELVVITVPYMHLFLPPWSRRRSCSLWCFRWRSRCCCTWRWRRWGAWPFAGWEGSVLRCDSWSPIQTPGTSGPPAALCSVWGVGRATHTCSAL